MEKWKIIAIAAMLIVPVGFGIYQEKEDNAPVQAPTPGASPTPTKIPPQLGKVPPPWTISASSDWLNSPRPVDLADLQGKYALVEIFRINCPHCQDATPFMEQLAKRYSPRGLKLVGIQSPGQFKDPENSENDWNQVKSWVKEHGITYPIGFDRKSAYFQGTFKGTLYPTMMLLDHGSRVRFFQTGFDPSKALALATAAEKALPGPGSIAQRAEDLAKWMAQFPNFSGSGQALYIDMVKELSKADAVASQTTPNTSAPAPHTPSAG